MLFSRWLNGLAGRILGSRKRTGSFGRRGLLGRASAAAVGGSWDAGLKREGPSAAFGEIVERLEERALLVAGTFNFAMASSNPMESVGMHMVTVSLNTNVALGNGDQMSVSIVNNTMASSADAADSPFTTVMVTFTGNGVATSFSSNVSVSVVDDMVIEPSETFVLTLFAPVATNGGDTAMVGGVDEHTVTIADNDSLLVNFNTSSTSDEEGYEDNEPFLVVTGDIQAGHSVTVSIPVIGGSTAMSGSDFVAPTNLTVTSGSYSNDSFLIPSLRNLEDLADENGETVILDISGTQVTTGAIPQTTYTINDNDNATDATFNIREGNGADSVRLVLSGGNVEVRSVPGNVLLSSRSLGSLTDGLLVQGADNEDDTLTVDFSGGNPIPAAGLFFDGGNTLGATDTVALTGYTLNAADGIADVTVNHTGAVNGTVVLNGLGTVNFNNITPLILAGTAADLVINLPAGGNPDVLLADDTGANFGGNGNNIPGRSAIDGSTFEYTEFVNPTNSLLINLGNGGDSIEVRSMDGGFAPAAGTIIQGGNLNDTFINTDPNAGTIMRFLGGAGDDTFTINATLTGQIDGQGDGGGGGDTLNGTAIDLLTLLGSDVNGFNGTEADITGDFDGIDSFVGNAGSIIGVNVASTWSVNGATVDYSDGLNTAVISGFANLNGGTASDSFTVTAVSSFNLLGGTGANSGNDTFTIDATLNGLVNGRDGSDILQGTQITNVTLTAFVAGLGFSGMEADITGNFLGIDDLRSTPGAGVLTNNLGNSATWNLGVTQTYVDNPSGGTLDIQGFTTLNAGNQGDTFNVTANTNATLNGGTGADTFDLSLGATLTGEINGNTGSDTLQGSGIDAVVLTTSNGTGYSGNENSITNNPGFEGIDNIVGSNLAGSTLQGRDFASTWTLQGASPQHNYNDGLVNLPFSGFRILQGGISGDEFNLQSNSVFAAVRGGDGGDTFNFNVGGATFIGLLDGQGGLDLLQGSQIDNVTLTGSTGDREFSGGEDNILGSVGFVGIGNIVGSGVGTLTGQNVVSAWNNIGAAATYNNGAHNLDFSQFSTLQGGDAQDFFIVTAPAGINLHGGLGGDGFILNAPLTGGATLNGGEGSDSLSGVEVDSVTLTGATGIGEGFSGVVGASAVGFLGVNEIAATGTGTLTGAPTASTWTLDGAAEQYASAGETLLFTGFPTLQGGAGVDTFDVVNNVSFVLRGGDSADLFRLSAVLTGNIFGDAGADNINFLTNDGEVTGNIDGGANGAGLDFSATSNSLDITLSGPGSMIGFAGDETGVGGIIGGTFDNIDRLVGEPGQVNQLSGDDAVATWNFGATQTYFSSGRTVTFSSFEIAFGGTDSDRFNVTSPTTIVLFGRLGADLFDIDAVLTGKVFGGNLVADDVSDDTLQGDLIDAVVLTNPGRDGFNGTENSIVGDGFEDINTIIGAGAGSSLTGDDAVSTWALSNAPTYTSGGATINISNFENLIGGSAIDTFDISQNVTFNLNGGDSVDDFNFIGLNAAVTGTVNGGAAGASLDYSNITAGLVVVGVNNNGSTIGLAGTASGINGMFDNITSVVGTGVNDLLVSNLLATESPTFEITGANAGQLDNGTVFTLDFTSFATLISGGGADTFVFLGGSLSGDLLGNGGIDTLDYQNLLGPVTVNFATGTASLVGIAVAGIENAIGTNSGDSFTGAAASANIFTGLDGNDTYNLVVNSNMNPSDVIVDSSGDDTINFSQATIPINLDLDLVGTPQPGSTAGTYDVTLNGEIENYTGSATQNDILDVDANALPGTVRTLVGGGETTADTLNIDATGLLVTVLSATSFGFSNGAIINFTGWEAVNLTGAETINLIGTAGADDELVVTATGPDSGSYSLNGGPAINFTGLTGLTFNGLGGNGLGTDDVLTIINPVGGLFAPNNGVTGITFNAGGGGQLNVQGGTALIAIHTLTNNSDGSIVFLDGNSTAAYTYTGLAPIVDTVTATTRTFTFNGANETIDLTDDAVAGQMTIDSTLGESVTFVNPTGSLTINTLNGTDTINLTSVDAAFNASLTVNADGDDTISLGTSLNLGSATATGDLSLTAGVLNLGTTGAITINTDGAPSGVAGSVTLAVNLINIDQNVTIDTNAATTDGNILVGGGFDAVTGGARSLTFDVGTTDLALVGDFSTLALTTADQVTVAENNAIDLGTSVVGNSGGVLIINANGAITQSGAITQAAAAGAASFIANNGPITLNLAGNDFTNSVLLNNIGANNVAITDTNALLLNLVLVGTGTLTVTAGAGGGASGITQVPGSVIVQAAGAGAATFNGNAGVITLTEINNQFNGTVNANNTGANAIQITDTDSIDLGTVTTANNLRIEARSSGLITDSGIITVGGTTTLIAGNDIILDSVNTFIGTVQVSLTASNAGGATDRDLTLVDTTALQLDNLTPATALRVDTLNVTALGITQADALIVDGTTTLNGGAAAITLANASNDFIGPVNANNTGANAITLVDLNDINLGTVTTANNLSVTAGTPGSITDSGTITVGGLTTLTANGGSIVLDNANTFTGLVQVSLATTGDLTLNDTTALNLENQTVGVQTVTVNNLNITAVGITQTDNFTVNGTTTLSGLTGAVNLGNAANNFVGPVSASTVGAGGVTLADANAIVLANINTTGTLTVNAVGITQLAGSTIAVTGLTTLTGNAGVITLTNATNDFIGAVSANNTGANAIALTDTNNILLGTVNTANNLTVNSVNDITQNGGGVTVGGTSSFTSTGGNVLLNVSPLNNFTGDVSASAAVNVALSDANSISLGTVTANNNLSVIANGVGTITDTGVITVGNATQLTAGGDITLNSVNTFNGGVQVELVNSNSLTLVDTTGLDLDRLNPGTLQVTNLNITAAGITQTDTLIVTGTSTLNGGAAAITLNIAANDFVGTVSISNATTASIADLNAITFGAVTTTGDFTVDAGGNVALNGATTVGGNLDVQANANNPAGGAISGTGAIVVTGTTLLETGTPATASNDISLNNAANDFGGAVTITSANDASIDDLDNITFGTVTTTANFTVDAGGAVVLAATTVGGNLDIEADINNPAGGAITGAAQILVTGTTSLDTGTPATAGNDITLNNATNDFIGAVTIVTANDASLNDANAVTFGPVATSANFTVDAGGAIALNGLTTVGGNLDLEADTNNAAGGAISGTGAITVTGTTTLETGAPATAANDITLNTVTNNFIGAVIITSANDASLDDANGITFGAVTTNANLDVDAAGAVDFTGVATIGGTLDVDTNANGGAGGTITDTGAGQLLVAGLTTLDAGATNDITLDNVANDFSNLINGVTVTAANDVSIDDANDIGFGAVTTSGGGNFIVDAGNNVLFDGLVTVTGNLDVDTTANNAGGGTIRDTSPNGRLLITGTTLLTAGNNSITLDTATNNFGGAVTIASAMNATLDDANTLTFAAVTNLTGFLVVDTAGAVDFSGAAVIGTSLSVDTNANGGAGGTITDSTGSLIVGTTTTLDAGTSAITLDTVTNDFTGVVTITAATNATIDDANTLTFGAVTITGNLDADSAGAVDFSGAATIGGTLDVDTNANGGAGAAITDSTGSVAVTGTSTLDAGTSAITLDNAVNNFIGAVTITAATNASLDDANAITFNNVLITGTLDVDAAGAVTFNGTTTIGTNLDVDTNANGGLGGDITDGAAGVLTVTGTTTLDAGTSNVTLDTITNNYTGTVTVTAAGNVVLVDANSLNIAGINATGTVTATARGDNNLLMISGVVAAGGAVTFNADDMNLAAAIGAAGQTVTLLPFNAGDAINLGAAGETVLNTLELSAAEVLMIVAANLAVGNAASGPITVSATIMTAGATNVTLTTGVNNSILFSGANAQLNANGGNVTLNTDINGNDGIVSGANAIDVIANVLTVTAGQADIGSAGNPLSFNATTLVTTTGLNGMQFLREADTVTWNTSTATAGNTITLEGGTFLVGAGQTITASVLNVNAGVTLGGNGMVNATVTGAGNVAPGTSPGILTINGAFNPTGTTTIELNAPYALAGTDFDQLIVNGTINLGGSMLVVAGGAVAPAAGTIIPILLNDGVDAITGIFNFADGAMVMINNFTGFISYFGGDGNDVTLTVASVGPAIFNGTAGSDVFEIRQISETVQVLRGGVIVDARPIAAVTPLGYTINGLAGNDSLNVNYGASGGIFNIPVTFNGGDQTVADSLTVNGGAFNTVVAGANLVYSVTGTGAGILTFDNTGMVDDALIVFTGLEPVTVNSALGSVTIDIDNGADAFAGPITTTILDAAGANLTVDFDVAAEDITFSVPSVALTILGDNDGNDVVNVTSVDGTFRAALSIDGQGATDVINVATSLLLGSATSSGNLALSAETINLGSGAAAITLATDGAANAGTVTLTATTVNIDQNTTIDTNAVTTDALLTVNSAIDAVTTTARTLTLDLGTTSVMLNNAANNFSNSLGTPGVVIASAANVTLVDAATVTGNGISLGNISMTGNLNVTSSGVVDFVGSANNSTVGGTLNITTNALGAITDTGTGSLTVTGVATLAAGAANDITLNNALNDFSTVIITSGNNVTLRDASAIDLGASTVSGALSVTTTNGPITDSGNVSVVGNANFVAGGALGTITLGDGGEVDNFGTSTFTATGAVSIVENSATILSGTSSAASLALTSVTGSITDAAGTSLTVTNNATFLTIGAAQGITLGDDPTDTTNFGSLSFVSTGAVSISENSATVVTGVNAALTLALTSETGSITDAAATVLVVTNGATFTTTGAGQAITLGDNVADVTTFGTLTFVSIGAVSISENDATVLTGNNSASSLVLTSETATITDVVGTTLNVTNNAAITTAAAAQAITLGDDPTDTTNFGSLTFTSTGAVSISENSATVLTSINTANALTLTSETGSITDNAGTSLTVTTNATFTTSAVGQAITLGDNAADTTDFGTLTFVSTGAVSISENGTGNGVDLTGVSTALSLVLIAEAGTIEDVAASSLTVTNNASFTSNGVGSGITLGDAAETTDFGTLTFNSTAAVSISENGTGDGVDLTGVNTALSLVLTAEAGSIEDAANTSLTVTNNALFTSLGAGSAITLGDNAGDTTNFGTLSFAAVGNVTITEDTTMNVAGVASNLSAALTLTSQTGDVRVQDTGVANDINATGAVTINVPTNERFFISDASTNILSGGAVSIAADKMSLTGTISAAGQTVTLRPFSTTDAINLGTAGDLNSIGNTLELSDAELDLITAANLVIGNAAAATGQTITVLGVTTPANAPNVTLVTGGNSRITFFNTGSLTATGNVTLTTSAAGTGGIDSGNAVVDVTAVGLLTISTGSGGIGTLAVPLTFATGTISTDTSSSNAGQFLLSTQAGAIGVVSFNAGTGTITLLDGDYTLTGNEVINNVTDITLTSPATIAMAGFTETFDALNGNGNVGGAGLLILGANNQASATHSGVISGSMGFTKIGTGTQTLAGANTYTGQTIVNGTGGTLILSGVNTGNGITDVLAGTLLVNGSTVSLTTVSLSGVLGGSGTINNNVTLQAGSNATFAPGSPVNTIADLAIVGNLTMNAGTTYSINVNGSTPNTQHDQTILTGNVILGGATLVLTGTITSVPGQEIVLIANDVLDTVTGNFAGLAEGSTVTINGVTFFVSYQGGLDGNDVTLTQAGPATYTSNGMGLNALELRLNGTSVQFLDDMRVIDARPLAAVVNQLITVNGTAAQNDTLTVNYATASGFFDVDVLFHGGTGGSDALVVSGGTTAFANVTHTFTATGPEHSGNIAYNTSGATVATVSYDGLEPVTMTGGVTTNLIFNLPNGVNAAILDDAAGAGVSQITSPGVGTFEDTTFTNPTGTLTINGGTGADMITLNTLDAAFAATVVINGGAGNDTLLGTLIDAVTLTNSSAAGFDGTEVSLGTTFTGFETITGNGGSLTGQGLPGAPTSTWNLNGSPTYSTGGNTLNFSGFLTLIGGDGDDTFNISANSTFNLIGGDGADTFAFTNPVVLTGSIEGGSGNDTLVGDDDGNAFVVTGADAGTLLPNTTGGWSNVENLTGGSGVDTFVVSLGGSLQGAISGLQGDDTLDLSAVVGASATITALNADGATLSPVTSIGGGASGINVLTGQGTGTLTGEDTDRTWNLDSGATGKTYTDGLNTLTFSDFATLQGGSGADTFNVIAATTEVLNGGDGADLFDIDATLTGSVNGQGGSDTLQGTAIVNVLLIASDATGFTGTSDGITPAPGPNDFTGIDNLIGTGTLTGRDVVSIWTLNGTATYFDGTATLTVSGFSTLQGGSDRDTFNVTGASTFNLRGGAGMDLFDVAAPLTGVIAGQAGQDTLQGALIDRVVLTGSAPNDGFTGTEPDINGGVTSFSGIDTLVGNGGTLTGEDVASTWGLDGTPTYLENATNRSLGFTGFNDLQGGSMADRFNVTNASTFNLLGGAGDDVFDIDAVLTGAIAGQAETVPAGAGDVLQGDLINDVTLFGSTGEGFSGGESDVAQSFTGINTITGNGGRLLGAGVNSTWLLDSTPTYNDGSARFLNFSGFATLQGSTANDTFTVTAASPFTLLGGAGNDRFTFNGGRLTNGGFADGEAGNDTLDGTGAIAAGVGQLAGLTLNGGAGNDSITGSSLNDVLSGGDGNDSINAAAGDDTLSGGSGNNSLNGGAGTDCVTDLVIANATLTNTSLVAIGNNTLISIECVELFGNGANNLIDASGFTPGVNVPGVILHGGAGDDTLVGTSKNDQLFGDAGFDTVRFRSTTGATIVATNGMLMDGAMMDVLNSIEALNLTGHASLGTTINAAAFSGNTTLSGGSGADTLTAGQKASQLNGNAGNDLLTGGAGADLFYGGAGNDTMNGGLGNDSMRGEAGNDSMEGGVGDDRLFGDAGGDRISGGDGQDSIGGGDGNDTLIGGEGHDSIGGDSGNDLISGGNGDDRLYGDAGNDTLLGGDGSDVLSGAGGKDLLLGGAGNDRIDGGGDKDTIAGQGGNDTISGSSDEINEFFIFDFHRLLI